MQVRIGCCGFPVARARYYERFSTVELQQTFYRPPRLATALRWREQAAAGFEFTMKAWQLITHEPRCPTYRRAGVDIPPERFGHYGSFRPTEEVYSAWQTTLEVAHALRARVVVFQCPPSFTPTQQHCAALVQFFSRIAREEPSLELAWEPRGSWSEELVSRLCRDLGLIHCVDPFQRAPLQGEPAYLRLHGIGGYRYVYTDDDLLRLLGMCRARQKVYCLFNNAQMWDSARRFQALLAAQAR